MDTIQVVIFGQTYMLQGGADAERVRALAADLDRRMREVQKGTGTAEGYRVAILTALNIIDELHRLRGQQDSMQRMTSQSVSRLLDMTKEHAGS